jgi:peptide-methionine (R)-S-oxide reductase
VAGIRDERNKIMDYTKDAKALDNLTREQYEVTQHKATERAFTGELYDNHEAGLYVDIVSGEPLFASINKYDSGSGWPSFTTPIAPQNVSLSPDTEFGVPVTEVRSVHGDSHLGHVFADGPADQGGLRYCINSASLRFVPLDKLEDAGYGEFVALFAKEASHS